MGSVRYQSVLPWLSLFLPLISLKPHVVSHPLTGITGCLRQELYSHPVFPSTRWVPGQAENVVLQPCQLPRTLSNSNNNLSHIFEISFRDSIMKFSMDKKLS